VFRILCTSALLAAAISRFAAAAEPAGITLVPPVTLQKAVIYTDSDPAAIDGFIENAEVTRKMVDHLVLAVTQERDVAKAWRSLVSPSDHVGIKVSSVGGRYFSSHKGVVMSVVAGLEAAGVPRSNVIVWDRSAGNLRAAGFTSEKGSYVLRSIDPPRGYDSATKITAPMFGKLIWGDLDFKGNPPGLAKTAYQEDEVSAQSHLATVLSKEVTKVINIPVLCDEEGCGVAGALYNMTVPNLDNNRRFTQNGGASSIVDVYATPQIGPKVVLHIMDGLVAQYAGGPAFNPNYAFSHRTLYASKDPVALDATALRLMERWRKEARLPAIGEHASWVQEAEVMGLGRYTEDGIEIKPLSASP